MITLNLSKLSGSARTRARHIVIPDRFSTNSGLNRTKRDFRMLFMNSRMTPSNTMQLTDT